MIDTAQKFADAGKASLDTMMAVFSVAFDSGERLVALNLGTSRSLLNEGAANADAALDVKNIGDLFKLEATMGRSVINMGTECVRNAFEIVTQGQQEIWQLIEPRITELNKEITTTLDDAVKSMPAGSDLAFAAVMSALEVAKRSGQARKSSKDISSETLEEASDSERKTA